jgi:hypothetical protein
MGKDVKAQTFKFTGRNHKKKKKSISEIEKTLWSSFYQFTPQYPFLL